MSPSPTPASASRTTRSEASNAAMTGAYRARPACELIVFCWKTRSVPLGPACAYQGRLLPSPGPFSLSSSSEAILPSCSPLAQHVPVHAKAPSQPVQLLLLFGSQLPQAQAEAAVAFMLGECTYRDPSYSWKGLGLPCWHEARWDRWIGSDSSAAGPEDAKQHGSVCKCGGTSADPHPVPWDSITTLTQALRTQVSILVAVVLQGRGDSLWRCEGVPAAAGRLLRDVEIQPTVTHLAW